MWRIRLTASEKLWTSPVFLAGTPPHPDIRECVSRIDIMRMGHAMIRPTPGFLTRKHEHSAGNLFYANSDLSGISIFEEAQYRGVRAADRALKESRLSSDTTASGLIAAGTWNYGGARLGAPAADAQFGAAIDE